MPVDPTNLAGASGLIGTYAPTAPNLNGVTSLKKSGDATDVFGLGKDDFFKLFLAQLQNQLRAQHHGGHDRRDQQHGGRHDLEPETLHRSSNPTPLTVRSWTGEPTRSSLRRMRVA